MNESKYLTISDASSQESFKNGFLSGLSFAYETRKLTTSMEVLEQELSTAIESVKENIEASLSSRAPVLVRRICYLVRGKTSRQR